VATSSFTRSRSHTLRRPNICSEKGPWPFPRAPLFAALMALITILDAHRNAHTGAVHDWHAVYLVEPDGASVSVTVHIPGRARPLKMQTYLTFDAARTNATARVSDFAQRLIDVTDLAD